MIYKKKAECCGCEACYNICPKDAIIMEYDGEGFKYPHIDKSKCINCGLCEKVCPCIANKVNTDKEKFPQSYACYNTNEEERIPSSSGGIFTLIAKEILKDEGVVYGAAYDEEYGVEHRRITSIDKIAILRGSKYLQSSIGESFRMVKADLDAGKKVLFSGTACQIEGLLMYLRKPYDTLYTIDLICKSIPSPVIWKKYLKAYFKNKDIKSINFKDKSLGWDKFSLRIDANDKEYKIVGMKSLYMRGFFKGIYARPSCFECVFKGTNRKSDITLADCWGVHKMAPELFDNKGISSILINSDKGKEIFDRIKTELVYKETEVSDIEKYNPYISKCTNASKVRKLFYVMEKILPFKVVLFIFCYPFVQNMIDICSRIKRKILK